MVGFMDTSMDRGRFMESSQDYGSAQKILLGAPMDFTSSGRPGSRFGPQSIRAASELLEDYSPHLDKQLSDACFYDAGDVLMPFGDVQSSLRNLEAACTHAVKDGKAVVVLGGEHLVTVGAVRAVHQAYESLAILHFDAHADLRDDYLGQKLSHATAMRRVAEIVGMDSLWQFGIRSGTRDEYSLMRTSERLFGESLFDQDERIAVANRVSETLGSRPVYITIDIDVLDPAVVPGTGTPEPGGLSFRDLMDMLMRLRQLNVVGFDVVEVNPLLDSSGRSSVVAAKLVRELLTAF